MATNPIISDKILRKVKRNFTTTSICYLHNAGLGLQTKMNHTRSLVKSKEGKRTTDIEEFVNHNDSFKSSYDEHTEELYENKLKPGKWNTPFFSPGHKQTSQKNSVRAEMKHSKSLKYHVLYKHDNQKNVFPNLKSCFTNDLKEKKSYSKFRKEMNSSHKSKQPPFGSSFGKNDTRTKEEHKSYLKSFSSYGSFCKNENPNRVHRNLICSSNFRKKKQNTNAAKIGRRSGSQPILKLPKRSGNEEYIKLCKVPETVVYLKNFVTLNKNVLGRLKDANKLKAVDFKHKLWKPDLIRNLALKCPSSKLKNACKMPRSSLRLRTKIRSSKPHHPLLSPQTLTKNHQFSIKKRLQEIMNIPIKF
ncbi:unnamed protein product [Moneuplotes crassus]|uniref:Uncharacterized protein n=1 Tax=Euplotes crassus TaxID=5936 RepID=A0AAD1UKL1_EUPCR|nr:unnamed protein product [Moneuplotes crassus]